MRPDFRISGLSAAANDRVLSLQVIDNAGTEGSSCTISLDDRDYRLEWPPKGLRITVFMGYKETGLVQMGEFEIDQVRHKESQAATMEITANAQYHLNSGIKKPIIQPWDDQTLGGIAGTIAGRNGYTPNIHPELAGIHYDHLDQAEESDTHFLSRLAERHDAYVKFQDGVLVFWPRSETLAQVTVERSSAKQWTPQGMRTFETSISFTLNTRHEYSCVRCCWHDPHSNQRQYEEAGGGEPRMDERRVYESKEKAQLAAAGKLRQLQRGTAEIDSLVIPGDPQVRAAMDMTLVGFRPEVVERQWIIKGTTHHLDSGGYKTTIKAEQKDAGE